jgi:hypothetical protein
LVDDSDDPCGFRRFRGQWCLPPDHLWFLAVSQ